MASSKSTGAVTRLHRGHAGQGDSGGARSRQQSTRPGDAQVRVVDEDQHNLTAYLKRLADDRDPGLDADSLHLGTLLPGSGALSEEEGATVAAVLNGCVARINEAGGIHGRQLRLTILGPGPTAPAPCARWTS